MRILLTDSPWGEPVIERARYAAAGHELVLADRVDEDRLAALASGCAAITTCWAPVTRRVIDAAGPGLRHVARYGVGLDNIDVAYARSRGILVTNVPDYCVEEVADHTFSLLLGLARHVSAFDRHIRAGGWGPRSTGPVHRLQGQVCGIVGLGRIGRAVARRAAAFGMSVIAHSNATAHVDVDLVDLPTLFRSSDYVTLHAPLNDRTKALVNAGTLRLMKPTAFLINTARGGLVDTEALEAALRSGAIAGAGLDVYDMEPPGADHPMLALDNVIATPHCAFYSEDAVEELQTRVVEEVLRVHEKAG